MLKYSEAIGIDGVTEEKLKYGYGLLVQWACNLLNVYLQGTSMLDDGKNNSYSSPNRKRKEEVWN